MLSESIGLYVWVVQRTTLGMEEVSECWGLPRDVWVVIRKGRNGSVGANGEH